MSDTIALMWDCNGLEAAEPVEDMAKKRMWGLLQGQRVNHVKPSPNLGLWRIRAEANPQRHYEIYLLEVEDGTTVEDVREAFEAAPQEMADTVRRIGHRYYSDRAPVKVRIR
jgi:hypothetical protein